MDSLKIFFPCTQAQARALNTIIENNPMVVDPYSIYEGHQMSAANIAFDGPKVVDTGWMNDNAPTYTGLEFYRKDQDYGTEQPSFGVAVETILAYLDSLSEPKPEPITVGPYKVEMLKGESAIKVGCSRVSKDTFERIGQRMDWLPSPERELHICFPTKGWDAVKVAEAFKLLGVPFDLSGNLWHVGANAFRLKMIGGRVLESSWGRDFNFYETEYRSICLNSPGEAIDAVIDHLRGPNKADYVYVGSHKVQFDNDVLKIAGHRVDRALFERIGKAKGWISEVSA